MLLLAERHGQAAGSSDELGLSAVPKTKRPQQILLSLRGGRFKMKFPLHRLSYCTDPAAAMLLA